MSINLVTPNIDTGFIITFFVINLSFIKGDRLNNYFLFSLRSLSCLNEPFCGQLDGFDQ